MAQSIGGIDLEFLEANHRFNGRWRQLCPGKEILPKGWRKAEGRRALDEDLVLETDVCITLRDNARIWVDVFRPVKADDDRVPAILSYSPYGKQGNGMQILDNHRWRVGVPRSQTSDLEKFEGLDPAEWCPRGYAVVNLDSRGVFDSDGDMYWFGTQDGRDGYDAVEFIAKQSWCNGKVALAGNSYLGASQWFIAAEQPPHLAAIAPWEGLGDVYREMAIRGGIPNSGFFDYRGNGYCGRNRQEDIVTMIRKYPYWNDYWKDKSAKLENVVVPIYVVASYSTMMHTEGSLNGFLFSSSANKWLRIHDTQEWYDTYQQWQTDDLQRFFDHYLYERENDWEQTPKVRQSLLGFNRGNIVHRAETSYPPSYVKHHTFYLDADSETMTVQPVKHTATATYQSSSWEDDGAHFTYKFDTYTEIIGYSQAKLYMSCSEADDMDVYVICRKLDHEGKPLVSLNIPMKALPPETTTDDIPDTNIFKYLGPNGRLRASHRRLSHNPDLTEKQVQLKAPTIAWHSHKREKEEKIPPGQIVCLDIPLWATGMIFEPGESVRFEIKGHEVTLPEFPRLYRAFVNLNKGRHVIHTGAQHSSSLTLSLNIKR